MPAAIVEHIVQQHAEEAAFLWLLRDNAVRAPHYNLKDLVKLDNRLEAHIDGLRIADDAGWQLCQEALVTGEFGEMFAASVLAFESGKHDRILAVMQAVTDNPLLTRGLIAAFGWLDWRIVARYAQKFANVEVPAIRHLGIAAYAIHRQDPGNSLQAALQSDASKVWSRALKAAGELGRLNLLPLVEEGFSAAEEEVRFYASWSAVLLGSPNALTNLQNITVANSRYSENACAMVARLMALPEAQAWLSHFDSSEDTSRLAAVGMGAAGNPAAIPWLISIMEVPALARIAGEAFSMITGVDLAYADLEGEWSEGFEAGPTENPEDEDVAMDPDEDLPWPDPQLVADWWSKNQAVFQHGTRYLAGKPIAPDNLRQILRTGFQRQRAAAAIELALLHPGQPLFEVRAPGCRQQKLLLSGRS
jgi:uncharacterized protein (TIGR02270 family)